MKNSTSRFRKYTLVVALMICSVFASAQNIVQLEYFFDNDPGVGNGFPFAIPSSPDSVTFSNSISTAGLSTGEHFLFIRAKQLNGQWSLYESRQFYIKQQIIKAEYFFDTDPGFGNGSIIPVNPGIDSTSIASAISTVGLTPGYHILFIRTKGEIQGQWSMFEPREFYIKNAPAIAEYFFDVDPGAGNGTLLPGLTGADSSLLFSSIPTSGLTTGYHVLFVRTRDLAGQWSLYEPREFFIKQPAITAEYFFDTDPGVGNGISISVVPGTDSTQAIASISTTGLPTGNHILFVRTKDASGHWSLYEPREFYVRQSIIAAEYFIDSDPGLGNGTALTVSSPSDSVTFNAIVTTTALTFGIHHVFVRTKDQRGIWSLYEHVEFTTGSPLPVEFLSFDAKRNNQDALLSWATASEVNCQQFDIERMIPEEGNEFHKIGEVEGNGNSTTKHEYNFVDENVKCKEICYYRLKQIDFDGRFEYSMIATVKFDQQTNAIKVYPNPSSDYFMLDITGNPTKILNIEIINASGQLQSTVSDFTLPLRFGENLNAGTYYVKVNTQQDSKPVKIIRVN